MSHLTAPTLLLSTSLDWIIRRSQLPILQELLQDPGHIIISFLWDQWTTIDPRDALRPGVEASPIIKAWRETSHQQ